MRTSGSLWSTSLITCTLAPQSSNTLGGGQEVALCYQGDNSISQLLGESPGGTLTNGVILCNTSNSVSPPTHFFPLGLWRTYSPISWQATARATLLSESSITETSNLQGVGQGWGRGKQ